MESLLDVREALTPADHQTHRRHLFHVPPSCEVLHIHVRYSPKRLSRQDSVELIDTALRRQSQDLEAEVGGELARTWTSEYKRRTDTARIGNLLTISLDDASSAYRGAGHRSAEDQQLVLGRTTASPGLVPGDLPAGAWVITVSVHTLVSPHCELSIQIGAETASTRAPAPLSSA